MVADFIPGPLSLVLGHTCYPCITVDSTIPAFLTVTAVVGSRWLSVRYTEELQSPCKSTVSGSFTLLLGIFRSFSCTGSLSSLVNSGWSFSFNRSYRSPAYSSSSPVLAFGRVTIRQHPPTVQPAVFTLGFSPFQLAAFTGESVSLFLGKTQVSVLVTPR